MSSAFTVKTVPIDSVKGYEFNARIIPQEAIEKVAASIKEFGWQQPIVANADGIILAGHTRHLAAKHLGLTEVPVHFATGLTKDEEDAYRLMDNRSNQESMWDNDLITEELNSLKSEGYDLALTGFNASEISTHLEGLTEADDAEVMAKAKKPTTGEPDHSDRRSDPSTKTQIVCPRCGKHFVEA